MGNGTPRPHGRCQMTLAARPESGNVQVVSLKLGEAPPALGYTQAEAAERIGLTEKALERRLSRTRARILMMGLDP